MTGPAAGQPSLRLFVAIELPDAWKEQLGALQRDMQSALDKDERTRSVRVRWVRPDGIHLTLKFLGYVPEARLDSIHEALNRAVPVPPGFELVIGHVGSFSDRRAPRVIWAGVAERDGRISRLLRLVEAVETWLQASGFPRERRGTTPHLTLARLPERLIADHREAVAAVTKAFDVPKLPSFPVESVSLMQSHLGLGGARYERLRAYPG